MSRGNLVSSIKTTIGLMMGEERRKGDLHGHDLRHRIGMQRMFRAQIRQIYNAIRQIKSEANRNSVVADPGSVLPKSAGQKKTG